MLSLMQPVGWTAPHEDDLGFTFFWHCNPENVLTHTKTHTNVKRNAAILMSNVTY